MSVCMANIAEIEAILDYIESHPDEWEQRDWAIDRGGCGTAYCVAGHAVIRAGWAINWEEFTNVASWCAKDNKLVRIDDVAQNVLGLTGEQADALFWGSNTLEDLRLVTELIANGEI